MAVRPADLVPKAPDVDGPAIAKIGQRFQSIGVPAASFTPDNYLKFGFTDKLFARHLRGLSSYDTPEKLEKLTDIGKKHKIFDTVRGMSVDSFYQFLLFLRTPEGLKEIAQLALARKLTKRSAAVFNAEKMAYNVNETRLMHASLVDAAEKEVIRRKTEIDTAILAVRARHLLAGNYIELSTEQFNRKCWRAFQDNCTMNGLAAAPLSLSTLKEAVDAFATTVRWQHQLEYLEQGNNKDLLVDYTKVQIGKFEADNIPRKAKRLRDLLEIVGRGEAPALPVRETALAARQNTTQVPDPAVDEDIFSQDVGSQVGAQNLPLQDVAALAQAADLTQVRDGVLPIEHVDLTSLHTRAGTQYRGGTARDPDFAE